jgi:hypothetical protein
MFAHCPGPIWQSDDLSRCFEVEYVIFRPPKAIELGRGSAVLPTFFGTSILIEVLQLPRDSLSVDRLRSLLPYSSTASLPTKGKN